MSISYFPLDDRIMELAPRATRGDREALAELRRIYDNAQGAFDPSFGREIQALLENSGA